MSIFGQDYYSIVGRIRALEDKMLNASHIDQMLDSSSAEDSYQVLNDTDYSGFISKYPHAIDFEKLISGSLLQTKELLSSSLRGRNILKILWHSYDVYNAKTVVKAKLKNKEFSNIDSFLSPFGSIDKTKMRDFVYENEHLSDFSFAKTKAEDVYKKTSEIVYIDYIFEKLYFEKLSMWSKELESEILTVFIKKSIDMNNAKIYFRMSLDAMSEYGKDVFISGGNIPVSVLLSPGEEVKGRLIKLFDQKEEIINEIEENQSYRDFEKETQNVLSQFISGARYISDGFEPVYAYWWARQKTSEIIRTIMIGKLNKIPDHSIRKNLINLY